MNLLILRLVLTCLRRSLSRVHQMIIKLHSRYQFVATNALHFDRAIDYFLEPVEQLQLFKVYGHFLAEDVLRVLPGVVRLVACGLLLGHHAAVELRLKLRVLRGMRHALVYLVLHLDVLRWQQLVIDGPHRVVL